MKIRYLSLVALCVLSWRALAIPNDCKVDLYVAQPFAVNGAIPTETCDYLSARLSQVVTSTGVISSIDYGQFFITGQFHTVYYNELPGPPMQSVVQTELSIYIGDMRNKSVYAVLSMPLKGVGTSRERAFHNALRGITVANKQLTDFIVTARDKIIDYYNTKSSQILAEAHRVAQMHRYEEALFLLSQIPACCQGYSDAMQLMLTYFQEYLDCEGSLLLNKARGAWAASPDAAGASEAMKYIVKISPKAAAYKDAEILISEIGMNVKSDHNFEMRDKHRDEMELETVRLEAAKAVGVAFGKGQQPSTTNLVWLK